MRKSVSFIIEIIIIIIIINSRSDGGGDRKTPSMNGLHKINHGFILVVSMLHLRRQRAFTAERRNIFVIKSIANELAKKRLSDGSLNYEL